jgi:ABC-type lipoprotein release transport system permease subunit
MMDIVDNTGLRAGFPLLAKLHLRMMRGRPEMDILAVILLATVGCLAGFGLMLSHAINDVFGRSGDSTTVLVLANGGSGEAESFIDATSVSSLQSLLSERGETDLDYDPQVVISAAVNEGGVRKFLSVRGLSDNSFRKLKRGRIIEGKMYDPKFNQLIIGKSALRAFPSFRVGSEVEFAKQKWVISGIFDMGGDVRENEVIGDLGRVQFAYRTGSSVNSIRIAAADTASVQRIINIVDKDDTLELVARTEKDYFKKRSEPVVKSVARLQMLIMGLMIPACLLGVLSIQRVQHSNMLSELRMLNFIGFHASSIQLSLLARVVLVGGVAALIASLVLAFGVAGRSAEFDLGLQVLDIRFVSAPWIYCVLLLGTCALTSIVGWVSKVDKELYQ